MVKILITGKNSFVGKNFIKYSQYSRVDEISLINNRPEEIDFNKYDIVLHLVAIVHQTRTIPESDYFHVNKDLALRTAKAAKAAGVKQFVFMSTVKVYGEFNVQKGAWNEESVCKPGDAYGKSKYEAEIALKKLEDNNFTVSIVRTPLVYGEDVRANMLSLIKLVEKFPVLPLGKIKNKRSFTSAQNLVAFIDRIIEKKASGVFIAKDEKDLSTTELVTLLSNYLDKKVRLIPIPKFLIALSKKVYPKIFDRLYGSLFMDNKKTRKQLDFMPTLSVEEGLKKMIAAYKQTE